jgi:hypothetical protein
MAIRCRLVVIPLLAGLLAPDVARAQLDSERRASLELGLKGPLRGSGSFSGYGFFLWNPSTSSRS